MSGKGDSSDRPAVGEETRTVRKQYAPAAARNAGPIVDVLRGCLPETGRALEIASGTGQHAAAFAGAFPGIVWHPSDPDGAARDSIAAWVEERALDNLRPPLNIDVMRAGWADATGGEFDVIVCINMVHISPWAACEGLMDGAGTLLAKGGLLYLYGPYRRGGEVLAPSNVAFDQSLRSHNPDWGIRDRDEVETVAAERGLVLTQVIEMPANNHSLIFRKTS